MFAVSTGIAVVGENTWSILEAKKKLNIEWDYGSNQNINSSNIRKSFLDAFGEKGQIVKSSGDFNSGYNNSNKKLEAIYEGSFLDHATMEPMNCTVKIENNSCELWLPTQDPAGAFEKARDITGFNKKNITIHTLKAGGGFGRRLAEDYVQEAVEVAMIHKGTVKVIRTREEDIKNGVYRPATHK